MLVWLSGLTVYEFVVENNPNIVGANTVQCSLDVSGTPYRVYATVGGQTVVADEDSGLFSYSFQANRGSKIYIHGFGDNGLTITLKIGDEPVMTQSGQQPNISYSVPL